jgi:hypothetical protein
MSTITNKIKSHITSLSTKARIAVTALGATLMTAPVILATSSGPSAQILQTIVCGSGGKGGLSTCSPGSGNALGGLTNAASSLMTPVLWAAIIGVLPLGILVGGVMLMIGHRRSHMVLAMAVGGAIVAGAAKGIAA